MLDSDKENLSKVTLEEQYEKVKEETNTSTVCQFGDMTISKQMLSDFQGSKDSGLDIVITLDHDVNDNYLYDLKDNTGCGRDAVPGPEVPRVILEKKLEAATTDEEKQDIQVELETLLANRNTMEVTVNNIITYVAGNDLEEILNTNIELTNFVCHSKVVSSFHENCYNLGCNGHAMTLINHFATLCELKYDTQTILDGISAHCVSADNAIYAKTCGIH